MRVPLSLKARALGWIAQREHSRVELERKLLRVVRQQQLAAERDRTAADPIDGEDVAKQAQPHRADGSAAVEMPVPASAADVSALLDWLVAHDLVNHERFVATRIAARTQRFGMVRIEHELSQHGLQADADALQQLRDTEAARARAVWHKRFGTRPGADQADAAARAKQLRFLLGRGFSADVARRVVGGAWRSDATDD